jgi:hypothetical protein
LPVGGHQGKAWPNKEPKNRRTRSPDVAPFDAHYLWKASAQAFSS